MAILKQIHHLKGKLPPVSKEILPATPPGDLAYCASNLERFFSNPFCVISPAKTDIQKLHDQSGLIVILDDNNVFASRNTEICQLHAEICQLTQRPASYMQICIH